MAKAIWERVGKKDGSSSVKSKLTRKDSDFRSEQAFPINFRMVAATSLFCCSAMAASNEALRYVSYPTQSLAKSCKLVPIMIMGLLVERRTYSVQQYLGVALITSGIMLYNLIEINTKGHASKERQDTTYGMGLLILSLSLDGLVAAYQGMLGNPSNSKRYRKPTALDSMFLINLFSCAYIIPVAMFFGQIRAGMDFLSHSSEMVWLVTLFNASASVGQFFIYFTITQFSPLVCSTITTTRKFITVLMSTFLFGHSLSAFQWIAVLSVFAGLFLELGSKRTGKLLSRSPKKDIESAFQ